MVYHLPHPLPLDASRVYEHWKFSHKYVQKSSLGAEQSRHNFSAFHHDMKRV